MITVRNTQRTIAIDTDQLEHKAQKMLAAIGYDRFDLYIWLTTNKTIRHYNAQFRHKNSATDILSFPYHPYHAPGTPIIAQEEEDYNLGDIIISLEYVRKNAPQWQQTFAQRMDILLAHGIAHLLNYDHQTDSEYEQMQHIERKLLKSIGALR